MSAKVFTEAEAQSQRSYVLDLHADWYPRRTNIAAKPCPLVDKAQRGLMLLAAQETAAP